MCKDTSPEDCARIYAYWCIIIGIVFLVCACLTLLKGIRALNYSDKYQSGIYIRRRDDLIDPIFLIVVCALLIFVDVLYIVAGVLLCLGINRESAKMFKAGKYLSWFGGIGHFFLIFPTVFHVYAVLKLSAYTKTRWDN